MLLGVTSCGKSPIAPSTALVVNSISPSQGSTTGGTNISISGANFANDASVSVGGVVATNVAVQSSSVVTAVVSAKPVAGAADVVVTSGGHSVTLARAFTFVAPSGANQPPVISRIQSVGSRPNQPNAVADQDETVTLIATVTDAETSTNSLAFEWSGAGTFAASEPITIWHLPATVSPTPSPVTATLTVTETYVEGSVTHRNVKSQPFVMQVHDSLKEVGDISKDFLELFSQSAVPADTVVHNFMDGCGQGGTGKQDERNQTADNRRNYNIVNWRVGDPRVTVSFGGVSPYRARRGDAWAAVDVTWVSACLRRDTTIGCAAAGATRTDVGVDWVTARFDVPTNRWWLCDSDYESKSSTATIRLLR
jgi:IPT/TIG domain